MGVSGYRGSLSVLKCSPHEITARKVTTRRGPARGFLRLGVLGLVAGELLVGCASASRRAEEPPPAATPAPALGAEPALPPTLNLTELESLEHDLRESEARLDAELARKSEPSSATQAAPAEVEGEAPASRPQKSADSAGSAPGSGSGAAAGAPARRPRAPDANPLPSSSSPDAEAGERGSPCDLGCRALASMHRAQARICEIAGPGPRCQAAIERVEAATERVRTAGCECLAGASG